MRSTGTRSIKNEILKKLINMLKIKLKKTNPILIAIFFVSILYFGFEVSNDATSMGSYSQEILDKKIEGIASVTDGDTIKIGEKRVRLIWIDAPETKQTCFDENSEEYACGLKSKEYLINFADKKNVVCYYGKLDVYKRYLGECFVGEISMNKEMLKRGMAVVYSFKKSNPELIKLEEEAKENGRGMWIGTFELPQHYRKRMKNR